MCLKLSENLNFVKKCQYEPYTMASVCIVTMKNTKYSETSEGCTHVWDIYQVVLPNTWAVFN